MPAQLSPEVRDLLALHLVPGLGPKLTLALINQFGSARDARLASVSDLRAVPHIGAKLSEELALAMSRVDVDAELELMDRQGVHLLALGLAGYPTSLAEITDAPQLLYVRGTIEPDDQNTIALVGSRQCTAYGRRVAERLARGLASAGFTIVSGLARGIDGVVHRATLEAGGRTLAVLAGGLSKIYPPEHADLARDVEARGALITESAMRMEPMAAMFPARNRLISGLSRGVVIIEAAERSGALITARHAAEQGREVFAIPGPIDSPASSGTLMLIRQGAKLVRGVDDILEDLGGKALSPAAAAAPARPPELEPEQMRVWEFLAGETRHVDDIARHLSLAAGELGGLLMKMELKKVIRRLPGNQYEQLGR